MNKHISLVSLATIGVIPHDQAKNTVILTLRKAVNPVNESFIEAFCSQNTYLSKYWKYRNYNVRRLPNITLRTIIPIVGLAFLQAIYKMAPNNLKTVESTTKWNLFITKELLVVYDFNVNIQLLHASRRIVKLVECINNVPFELSYTS